jgi:hypothetical protein
LLASSRKDRLPTEFQRRNVFCHTCQTNQHLLVNLLANFLPSDPSDPEYAQRLEELPAYKNSLQARYPPVCESCASLVEQEIEEKNRMARTSALTGFLKETKGKEKARKVSASIQRKEARELRTLVWIVRGCLWGVTTTASIGTCAYGARTVFDLHWRKFNTIISSCVGTQSTHYPSFRKPSHSVGTTQRCLFVHPVVILGPNIYQNAEILYSGKRNAPERKKPIYCSYSSQISMLIS